MATTTKISIGAALLLVILSASIYVMMPENVKILVENTNTKLYYYEDGKFVLGATEYFYLYNGSTKQKSLNRQVDYVFNNATHQANITRIVNYKNNVSTKDVYVFDGDTTDVENVPVSHKAYCYNCKGLIAQFEFTGINVSGPTRDAHSPETFKNIKIEWQSGAYFAKVYNNIVTDKLVVKYKPTTSFVEYDIRMYDPVNTSNCEHSGANITCSWPAIGNMTISPENATSLPGSRNIRQDITICNSYNESLYLFGAFVFPEAEVQAWKPQLLQNYSWNYTEDTYGWVEFNYTCNCSAEANHTACAGNITNNYNGTGTKYGWCYYNLTENNTKTVIWEHSVSRINVSLKTYYWIDWAVNGSVNKSAWEWRWNDVSQAAYENQTIGEKQYFYNIAPLIIGSDDCKTMGWDYTPRSDSGKWDMKFYFNKVNDYTCMFNNSCFKHGFIDPYWTIYSSANGTLLTANVNYTNLLGAQTAGEGMFYTAKYRQMSSSHELYPNCVVGYKLDESSGNATDICVLDGQQNASTTTILTYGGYSPIGLNTNYEFTTNKAVTISDYDGLDAGNISFFIWAYRPSTTDARSALACRWVNGATPHSWCLWWYEVTNIVRIEYYDTSDDNYDTPAISEGNWHFIGFTAAYDGAGAGTDQICLYVDGIQTGCEAIASGIASSARDLIVGANNYYAAPNYGESWVGQLDEPYLFNTTLSSSQVKTLYYDNLCTRLLNGTDCSDINFFNPTTMQTMNFTKIYDITGTNIFNNEWNWNDAVGNAGVLDDNCGNANYHFRALINSSYATNSSQKFVLTIKSGDSEGTQLDALGICVATSPVDGSCVAGSRQNVTFNGGRTVFLPTVNQEITSDVINMPFNNSQHYLMLWDYSSSASYDCHGRLYRASWGPSKYYYKAATDGADSDSVAGMTSGSSGSELVTRINNIMPEAWRVMGITQSTNSSNVKVNLNRTSDSTGNNVANTDLVGEWTFPPGLIPSNQLLDSSGNGRTLTVTGSPVFTQNSGCAHGSGNSDLGCYNFTASGQRLSASKISQVTNLSFGAWIYQMGNGGWVQSTDHSIIMATDWEAGGWHFPSKEATLRTLAIQFNPTTCDTGTDGAVNTGWTVQNNTWYHVFVTIDGTAGTVKIYVNGVQNVTVTDANCVRTWIPPQYIDGWALSAGWMQGIIDDVRSYNRTLTASQVLDEYRRGAQGVPEYYGLSIPYQNQFYLANYSNLYAGPVSAGEGLFYTAKWKQMSSNNSLYSNCVAGWNLDEISSPSQSICSSNNGTWTNNVVSTNSLIGLNKSLTFDGGDDIVYVDDADNLDFDKRNFTIAFWFRDTGTSATDQHVISKTDGSDHGWYVRIHEYGSFYLYFWMMGPSGALANYRSIYWRQWDLRDSNWHFMILGINGTASGDSFAYIDGNSIMSDSTFGRDSNGVAPNLTNTFPLRIGAETNTSGEFTGSVDGLVLLNRSITQAEAQNMYYDNLCSRLIKDTTPGDCSQIEAYLDSTNNTLTWSKVNFTGLANYSQYLNMTNNVSFDALWIRNISQSSNVTNVKVRILDTANNDDANTNKVYDLPLQPSILANGQLRDISGNNYRLSGVSGAVFAQNSSCAYGSNATSLGCYWFDNSNDYLELPTSVAAQNDFFGSHSHANRTWDVWILPSNVDDETIWESAVTSPSGPTYGTHSAFWIGKYNTMCNNGAGASKIVYDYARVGKDYMFCSNTNLAANVLYHITLTYQNDTKNFSIYINGTLDATAINTSLDGVWGTGYTGSSKIGARAAGTVPYGGFIGRIRVWNATLTAAQVLDLHREGSHNYLEYYQVNENIWFANTSGTTFPVNNSEQILYAKIYKQMDSSNPLYSNLVEGWKLDESSGNAIGIKSVINLTISGDVKQNAGYTLRDLGTNYYFDGNQDYLTSASVPVSGTGNFSAFIWVKTTGGRQEFFDWGTAGVKTGVILWTYTDNFFRVDMWASTGCVGTSNIKTGTWHMVGTVYNGTNLTCYVDGVAENTVPMSGVNIGTANGLHIGISGDGTSYDFTGNLDEPYVFSRDLTASEVQKLYIDNLCEKYGFASNCTGIDLRNSTSKFIPIYNLTGASYILNSTDWIDAWRITNWTQSSTGLNQMMAFNATNTSRTKTWDANTDQMAAYFFEPNSIASGQLLDMSGNGKTLTISGSPVYIQNSSCNHGNNQTSLGCYQTTGAGMHLHTGLTTEVPNQTVAFWAYKVSYGASSGEIITPLDNVWAQDYWIGSMSYGGVNGGIGIDFYATAPNPNSETTWKMPYGEWHHIGFMFDGTAGNVTIWVDGVMNHSNVQNTYKKSWYLPNQIGGNYLYLDRWSNTIYDDVRIYNRTLTAAEFKGLAIETNHNGNPKYAQAPSGGGGDTTAPVVNVSLPANGTTYAPSTTVYVQFNTTEDGSCSLYFNGTFKSNNASVLANTLTNLTGGAGVSDGTTWYWIECNDSSLNTGRSANRTFLVDATPPVVTVTSPSNNSWTTSNQSNVSFTSNENASCSLGAGAFWYGTNASVVTGINTTIQFNSTFSDGLTQYFINCTDAYGNTGTSGSRNLYIDTHAPSINLSSPANNTYSYPTTITYIVNVTDATNATANCTIDDDGSFHQTNSSCTSTNCTFKNTYTTVQNLYWDVQCCDYLNNCAYSLNGYRDLFIYLPTVTNVTATLTPSRTSEWFFNETFDNTNELSGLYDGTTPANAFVGWNYTLKDTAPHDSYNGFAHLKWWDWNITMGDYNRSSWNDSTGFSGYPGSHAESITNGPQKILYATGYVAGWRNPISGWAETNTVNYSINSTVGYRNISFPDVALYVACSTNFADYSSATAQVGFYNASGDNWVKVLTRSCGASGSNSWTGNITFYYNTSSSSIVYYENGVYTATYPTSQPTYIRFYAGGGGGGNNPDYSSITFQANVTIRHVGYETEWMHENDTGMIYSKNITIGNSSAGDTWVRVTLQNKTWSNNGGPQGIDCNVSQDNSTWYDLDAVGNYVDFNTSDGYGARNSFFYRCKLYNGGDSLVNLSMLNWTFKRFSDNTVFTNDTLVCNGTFYDAGGQSESGSTFKWFRNGTQIGLIGVSSQTIVGDYDGGNFSKHDLVTCEYTPKTAGATGTASNSSAVGINNTRPVASNIAVSPLALYVGQPASCTYAYYDEDADTDKTNDAPVQTYWYVNGAKINNNVTFVNFTDGNNVSCSVIPKSDGSGTVNGTEVFSPNVTIQDVWFNITPVNQYASTGIAWQYQLYCNSSGGSETMYWYDNFTLSDINLTTGHFDYTPLVSGNYSINVTCSENISNPYAGASSTFWLYVTDSEIQLNGINTNRTYEYGSRANVSILAANNLTTCSDVYILGYGLNYACGINAFNFFVNLTNYTAIDIFTTDVRETTQKFRVKNWTTFTAILPNYLDIISATLDLTGYLDDRQITRFDDWSSEATTSKSYTATSNVILPLNMTFRNSKEVSIAQFTIQSPDAANLYVDICNNGTFDLNQSGTFVSGTIITLDADEVNGCINQTPEFSTITIGLNFSTGGTVNVSAVNFRQTDTYYAKDVYIDVNYGDGYYDYVLLGEISGNTGTVETFNSGSSYVDFVSTNTTGNNTFLFNITVPNRFTYTGVTLAMQSVSNLDSFTETFDTTTYINTTTTTADVQTDWGMATNGKVGGFPAETWVYSKSIPTYRNITTITSTVTDGTDDEDYADVIYYVSANAGTNWSAMNINGATTVVNGNNTMWKAKITSDDGVSYAYIYTLVLTGLGYAPQNISIDINNDGTRDYNYTGAWNGALTDITINASKINSAISNCTTPTCTIPVNFTFYGGGTIRLNSLEVSYTTDDMSIDPSVIQSFLTNKKTARTSVTHWNDSTTNKLFTNNVIAGYIQVPVNVIVDEAEFNLTGGYT